MYTVEMMQGLNGIKNSKHGIRRNGVPILWPWLLFFVLQTLLFSLCYAGVTPQQPVKILCLGDSITQSANIKSSYRFYLWKAMVDLDWQVDFIGTMESCYPEKDRSGGDHYQGRQFDRDHEGHWGWTADQILGIDKTIPENTGKGNLSEWLTAYTPDIVLLHLGHNDAGLGEPLEETKEKLKKIIALIQEDNPGVSILLAKVIPTDHSEWNDRLIRLNSVIQGIADDTGTSDSKVIVIDFSEGFDTETDTFDGIHPNQKGAEKMAAKWLKGIMAVYETGHPKTVAKP